MLMRPCLQSCLQPCGPQHGRDMKVLERVQRRLRRCSKGWSIFGWYKREQLGQTIPIAG